MLFTTMPDNILVFFIYINMIEFLKILIYIFLISYNFMFLIINLNQNMITYSLFNSLIKTLISFETIFIISLTIILILTLHHKN